MKVGQGQVYELIPMTNESGARYEFKETASIGRLLTGSAKAVVAPTGFEAVCKVSIAHGASRFKDSWRQLDGQHVRSCLQTNPAMWAGAKQALDLRFTKSF